jgi:PST family polysaccharide transporter
VTKASSDKDQHVELTGRRLAMGAGAMGLSSVLKVAIQLVMLPLMARLLGPGEFGLYALALPSVAFLQTLADGGFGNSLAREPESSEVVWSTAFWVLHGFCALLACVVIGWSFLLAYLAHQPRLQPVMAALSISFLFLPSITLGGARLIRRAQMVGGSIADLVASLLGAALGLGCAINHAGVWSLVAQLLCTCGARAVLINIIVPRLPTFEFQFSVLKDHFAIGGSMVGGRLSDFTGKILENALLSRSLGAPILGIYSFGNQASRFLCEALSNPCWASLYVQALHRDRSSVLKSYYKTCRLMGVVLFPATILIAASASTVIPLLLGHSWRLAAPVISIILPTNVVWVIGSQCSALLYANGRSALPLWITAGFAIGRVAAVAAAPWVGLNGVVMGVGIINVIGGCAYVVLPARATGSDPRIIARELAGPLVSAGGAGLACLALTRMGPPSLPWGLLSLSASGLIYIIILFLIDQPRIMRDGRVISSMIFAR